MHCFFSFVFAEENPFLPIEPVEPSDPADPNAMHQFIPPPPTDLFDDDLGSIFSESMKPEDNEGSKEEEFYGVKGFWELLGGVRTQPDPYEDSISLGETRLQLSYQEKLDEFILKATGELVIDPVHDQYEIQLKKGTGLLQVRELYIDTSPVKYIQMTIGRQMISWGTGDCLYVNDLFPKDYRSYYIGRDESYLTAPTDAAKFSLSTQFIHMDLVWTPRFDPTWVPMGERLSYYHPLKNTRVGMNEIMDIDIPDHWVSDDEWAIRIHHTLQTLHLAAYTYFGRWKQPSGININTGQLIYPKLNVYGLSADAPLGFGKANMEFGYYESRNDNKGDNPYVDNCEIRLLAGYQADVSPSLSMGAQYYIEILKDHRNYRLNLRTGEIPEDEGRHVMTLRMTQQAFDNRLNISLMTFYCPTDTDIMLRPTIRYSLDEYWRFSLGATIFLGNENHTYFSQYERNSNVFVGARYLF